MTTPPPIPPTPTILDTNKVQLVPEPLFFDGTASKFDEWMLSIEVYFTVHAAKFADDQVRSLAILSRMRGGAAGLWAKLAIETRIGNPAATWFTLVELKEQLVAAFRDHTTQQKARDKLEYLRQGEKQSIDSFFVAFDTLAAECQVSSDQQLIYLLERAVLRKYIQQIITTQKRPDTYKAYKDIVLRIARYHEQAEEQFRYERRRTYFFRDPVVKDKPRPEPPQHDKRTGTGVVFGGQGKAMDVDAARQQNRCFNCGKVGHFKRDCPDPPKVKFNARALALDLSDEEKRELVDQILPEEDQENTDQVFESVDI
jgi:hypothetical protein